MDPTTTTSSPSSDVQIGSGVPLGGGGMSAQLTGEAKPPAELMGGVGGRQAAGKRGRNKTVARVYFSHPTAQEWET